MRLRAMRSSGTAAKAIGTVTMPPAAVINLGDSWGVIGDSMSYGDRRPKMYAYWLGLAMNGRLRWLATTNVGTATCQGSNMGVSGQSTTQIAARASYIQAAGLKMAVFFSFENDGAAVAWTTMRDNYRTIIAAFVAGGGKRIYVLSPGVTKTVFASSTIQTRNAQLAAWIETTMHVEFPEAVAISAAVAWNNITLHNGAGGAGPDSFDGIHPNLPGAKKLGANIWAAIAADIQEGDAYAANPYAGGAGPGNLFAADFSGTGGTGSNLVAGYQVGSGLALTNTTGATVAASKGTLGSEPSQIIEIYGTATANARVQLREVCANVFAANDAFDGWGRIKVSNRAGNGPPVGLRALGIELAGGKHTFLSQYHVNTSEGDFTEAFEGIWRAQPDVMTTGASTFNTDVNIQPVTGTALDIRVEIGDVEVYNMTQEAA